MTLSLNLLSFFSKFNSFKNDSKISGTTIIPSQSYTSRQLRQFSFDILQTNNNSPTQVYLQFSFESDKWMLLNGSTYVNHPQNFELNCYTSYSVSKITVHVDIVNRNSGATTLNSFTINGKAYNFRVFN